MNAISSKPVRKINVRGNLIELSSSLMMYNRRSGTNEGLSICPYHVVALTSTYINPILQSWPDGTHYLPPPGMYPQEGPVQP